jgi:hypothetical protein
VPLYVIKEEENEETSMNILHSRSEKKYKEEYVINNFVGICIAIK